MIPAIVRSLPYFDATDRFGALLASQAGIAHLENWFAHLLRAIIDPIRTKQCTAQ
jgi:hypothetical protein